MAVTICCRLAATGPAGHTRRMPDQKRIAVRALSAAVVYGSLFFMTRDLGKSQPVAHAVAAVGVLQLGLLVAAVRLGRFLLARHRGPRQTNAGPESDYDDAAP
jgi:hypothetical protein